jgi:hypothetical protein
MVKNRSGGVATDRVNSRRSKKKQVKYTTGEVNNRWSKQQVK